MTTTLGTIQNSETFDTTWGPKSSKRWMAGVGLAVAAAAVAVAVTAGSSSNSTPVVTDSGPAYAAPSLDEIDLIQNQATQTAYAPPSLDEIDLIQNQATQTAYAAPDCASRRPC